MPEALSRLLCRAALRPSETVAVAADGAMLTAAALVRHVAAVAVRLPSGAIVGMLAEDGPDAMIAVLACRAAGATLVPLPLFFSEAQLGHIVADAGISLVLASAPQAGRAAGLGRPVSVIDGEADATISDRGGRIVAYTSGTTGRPKGVVLEATAVDAKATTLVAAVGAGPRDRHLSLLPMSLLLELVCAVHVVLVADATVLLAPRPAPGTTPDMASLLAAAAAARPTVSVLVPSLLQGLVEALEAAGRRAPESLRFIAVGGAPVAVGLAERAWRVGLPVHEGYGLTECCSVVALNRPGGRVAGTVGHPLSGTAVTIEEGEIVVEDPSVMTGYLHGAPAPRRWPTGDLGRIDDEGRLVVEGRRDDVIVTTQGRNLAPAWPEGLLLADPVIAHCVVAADGSYPCDLVEPVRDAGAAQAQAATLERWRELPDYARPLRVAFVAPGTFRSSGWLRPDGSIDRRAVAHHLRSGESRP